VDCFSRSAKRAHGESGFIMGYWFSGIQLGHTITDVGLSDRSKDLSCTQPYFWKKADSAQEKPLRRRLVFA